MQVMFSVRIQATGEGAILYGGGGKHHLSPQDLKTEPAITPKVGKPGEENQVRQPVS